MVLGSGDKQDGCSTLPWNLLSGRHMMNMNRELKRDG